MNCARIISSVSLTMIGKHTNKEEKEKKKKRTETLYNYIQIRFYINTIAPGTLIKAE